MNSSLISLSLLITTRLMFGRFVCFDNKNRLKTYILKDFSQKILEIVVCKEKTYIFASSKRNETVYLTKN